jgi:transcriptional regulator with XRE-family HTH domain
MDRELVKTLRRIVGANLRNARLRQGLTQEQAAELIGMSCEVYGRMERGGIFPRVARLIEICQKLGVSADQLLGLSVSERPLPTVEVRLRRDEWFIVTHRLRSLGPKLTPSQRQAARRHISDFCRVLQGFVEPKTASVLKQQKSKRAQAQEP